MDGNALNVVAHVAVSLDGATTGFEPDIGRFYELAANWPEDVTLAGSDTILAQEEALAAAPRPGPAEGGPLLAVVDGKGRVRAWNALREVGHWSGVVALYCASTPPRDSGPDQIVTGDERVDLPAALAELAAARGRGNGADGGTTVRVDSGGALIGALLAAGQLTEVSLLVHPLIAGGGHKRWWGSAQTPPAGLALIAAEPQDGGVVWLRYRVTS